jgi:signal transduction histidine kinase/CheY-like chemotaxis protein
MGASEARLRLIEQTADSVIVVGRDGVIRFVNPAAEVLLERRADELVGEPFGIPVVPGERTEVDVLRGGTEARVAEMRVVETDWEGEVAYLASLRDITERKHTEDAMRFLSEASRVLAGSLDYPTTLASIARLAVSYLADWCLIDLVEEDRTCHRVAVAHVDPAKEEQTGRLLGRHALDWDAPAGLPKVLREGRTEVYADVPEALLTTLAARPEDLHLIQAVGCKSCMIVPLRARQRTLGAVTLLAAESGRRYGAAEQAVAEELALRAALAVDNARLYDEAQEAVRRRDEFLAMLAHELRNPLAPILHAVQVMRLAPADSPTAPKTREVVERQARHMARLIDDLLDISRITRGKIEIRKERVDLSAVVAGAVQTCSPLMESRGHRLEVSLPPEPLLLEADPTRLEQVIANLLNNAAKYTEPGGHIRLSATGEDDQVVIRVRDTGIGIAPEMQAQVFEPFAQVDQSLERAQGGLGIGLTLVRGLVERHGGTVQVVSGGLGQGSEFVVRLPRGAVPSDTPTIVAHPANPHASQIVLVEDNLDACDMLRELLELWGHRVETAADGLRGVELIQRGRPDVALVDIGLPGLDGYQVAQRVRAAPDGQHVFLVALTGYGQPQDRRRALAAGFDAHLIKPVDVDQLAELLAGRASGR